MTTDELAAECSKDPGVEVKAVHVVATGSRTYKPVNTLFDPTIDKV